MGAKKILVIDDEEKVLSLVQLILSKEGYVVVTAKNSAEAIQMFQKERPDLIVADVMLPDMNGAEVVKLLQTEKGCKAPVIFFTGMISKKDEVENQLTIHIEEQNFPTLAKPFRNSDLLELIKKELGKSPEKVH